MDRDLLNQLGTFVFAGLLGMAFFRTYREPDKDQFTRLIYRYAEAMTGRGPTHPRTFLLATSVICAAVALMTLLFAAAELTSLHR